MKQGKMNHNVDFKTISSSQESMGDLQRLLSQGEYPPFTSAPIFESKFVQINRRGEPVSVHNRPSCVTIGICASNPSSPMPDVVLVAHEVPVSPQESTSDSVRQLSEQPSDTEHLTLARFFPLRLVEISVHNTDKHHLLFKLVNGRCYYLELCAPPDQQQHLFHLWLQLISLLKHPENTSNTEVNVKGMDFGLCHKKAPSPNNPAENRDDAQDMPNLKTEKEVAKQTTSNQVPVSGAVSPREESGRKGEAFHSSPKPTRQENTMQSMNIDPLDTKKIQSTEKRKTRTNTMKQESGKKFQTSGDQKRDGIISRLLRAIAQLFRR